MFSLFSLLVAQEEEIMSVLGTQCQRSINTSSVGRSFVHVFKD